MRETSQTSMWAHRAALSCSYERVSTGTRDPTWLTRDPEAPRSAPRLGMPGLGRTTSINSHSRSWHGRVLAAAQALSDPGPATECVYVDDVCLHASYRLLHPSEPRTRTCPLLAPHCTLLPSTPLHSATHRKCSLTCYALPTQHITRSKLGKAGNKGHTGHMPRIDHRARPLTGLGVRPPRHVTDKTCITGAPHDCRGLAWLWRGRRYRSSALV